eukprot:1781589-Prymnesium_polylepis.1
MRGVGAAVGARRTSCRGRRQAGKAARRHDLALITAGQPRDEAMMPALDIGAAQSSRRGPGCGGCDSYACSLVPPAGRVGNRSVESVGPT